MPSLTTGAKGSQRSWEASLKAGPEFDEGGSSDGERCKWICIWKGTGGCAGGQVHPACVVRARSRGSRAVWQGAAARFIAWIAQHRRDISMRRGGRGLYENGVLLSKQQTAQASPQTLPE